MEMTVGGTAKLVLSLEDHTHIMAEKKPHSLCLTTSTLCHLVVTRRDHEAMNR